MSSIHTFEGKRIALTGRFSQTRDRFIKELEAIGATTTKSVSSKTDYLIEGSGTWGVLSARAMKLGVVVLTEAEARAVIDGQHIEVVLPGEGGDQELAELIGEVRSLLANPPGLEVWRALAALLEHCTLEHLDALCSYIGAHTHQWNMTHTYEHTGCTFEEDALQESAEECPWQYETRDRFYRGELRVMPEKWSAELLLGLGSTKFELAHAIHLGANSKHIARALSSPHLTHIERLSLRPSPKPTTQLLKTLCQLEWLPRVTHLAISIMTLQAAEYLVEHTEPMGLELLDLSKLQHRDRSHEHATIETLATVPLFETVGTIVLSCLAPIRLFARQRRKIGSMTALHSMHLMNVWRLSATRLQILRSQGLFEGLETLELDEITCSKDKLPTWREIFDETLPESIKNMVMTRLLFHPDSHDTELVDDTLNALAQSKMLEHVEHLTLHAQAAVHDRIATIFDAHRPDLTLTLHSIPV